MSGPRPLPAARPPARSHFHRRGLLTFFKSGSRHAVTHVLKVTWDKAMGRGVRAQDLGPDGSHS